MITVVSRVELVVKVVGILIRTWLYKISRCLCMFNMKAAYLELTVLVERYCWSTFLVNFFAWNVQYNIVLSFCVAIYVEDTSNMPLLTWF